MIRRAGLIAGASAVVLLSASPAFASWSAAGHGAAAAKSSTLAATSGGTVSCLGGSATINLSWTASASSGVTYTVLKEQNAGGFTVLTTGIAGTSTTDSLHNGNNVGDQFFYEVQVVKGTNWVTADVQLTGHATVASVNGGGNSPKC